MTPAVGGLSAGTVGEASTALSSAAQVALQSLSHAMVSAEQQLQVLQEKQQQLLKLQQQVRDSSTRSSTDMSRHLYARPYACTKAQTYNHVLTHPHAYSLI